MTANGRLALIPARGGSRRLPRKNIIDFAGRPMLAWTVEAAHNSGLFSNIVVSTDDDEIASIAERSGASVLRRGASLSDDDASLADVVRDTLARWNSLSLEICLLLANCPLRKDADIVASYEQFSRYDAPALLSVTDYGWTPPFRAQFLQSRRLVPAFRDWSTKKSQLYPSVVCPSGAIYWARPKVLESATSLYVQGVEGFVLPWHRAIDIDTHDDLQLANAIHFALRNGFEFSS